MSSDLGISFISTKGLLNADEKFSYTEFSPSLQVSLSGTTRLKLGAKYSTKKLEVTSLNEFSQWDLASSIGNSMYINLGFSI